MTPLAGLASISLSPLASADEPGYSGWCGVRAVALPPVPLPPPPPSLEFRDRRRRSRSLEAVQSAPSTCGESTRAAVRHERWPGMASSRVGQVVPGRKRSERQRKVEGFRGGTERYICVLFATERAPSERCDFGMKQKHNTTPVICFRALCRFVGTIFLKCVLLSQIPLFFPHFLSCSAGSGPPMACLFVGCRLMPHQSPRHEEWRADAVRTTRRAMRQKRHRRKRRTKKGCVLFAACCRFAQEAINTNNRI